MDIKIDFYKYKDYLIGRTIVTNDKPEFRDYLRYLNNASNIHIRNFNFLLLPDLPIYFILNEDRIISLLEPFGFSDIDDEFSKNSTLFATKEYTIDIYNINSIEQIFNDFLELETLLTI